MVKNLNEACHGMRRIIPLEGRCKAERNATAVDRARYDDISRNKQPRHGRKGEFIPQTT